MLIGKDSSTVHSEELMADIASSPLTRKLLVSLGVHVLLVVLTSTPFIVLCFRYGTLDPRPEHERALAELREKGEPAKAAGGEQGAGRRAGTEAPASTGTGGVSEAGAPGTVDAGEGGTGQSKIEQEISEVSPDRPGHSSLSFDDVDSLE